jgi:hypothetical protein
MTAGSGLFSNQKGVVPYKTAVGKSGLPGEVGDLRRDIATTMALMAAICVQEFVDPLAASATNMMAATASQTTEDVLLPAAAPAAGALTQATIDNLSTGGPRQIEFTVGGSTPAERAPTATIHGKDVDGLPKVQTLALPNVADDVLSDFFSDIDKIVLAPGSGTDATVSIGLGALLGLAAPVVSRAGYVAVLQEVAAGSVVTTGTVSEGAVTAGSVTGGSDLSSGGTLGTETLIISVDGAAAQTVTFSSPSNTAEVVAAVEAVIPGIASDDGSDHLVLTSPTTGPDSSIQISGTSLVKLGMTAGIYQGADTGYGTYAPDSAPNGSTSYAVYYEYDAAA